MLKVQEVKETIITQSWVRATQHAMALIWLVLRVNTKKTAGNVDVLIFNNNLYIKEIKKIHHSLWQG